MIVDLFAGPGGLDVAAHWLGVPSIGIEFDESAVASRRAARLCSILSDVRNWSPTDFTTQVNVLAGGPPCQTYTVAGNGHGRRALAEVIGLIDKLGKGSIDEVLREVDSHTDPRTGLVLQPLIWALRALDANRPFEAILLEQVPAVQPIWDAMANVLQKMNYGTDVGILSTEEYGVPQTRRRAVLIARLEVCNGDVKLPSPTHQKYINNAFDAPPAIDNESKLPKWISMGETLGIESPFYVESNYGSGGDPKNRSKRLHNRPAFTVTSKATRNKIIIDGEYYQRFGVAEAGRLQTFPDGYPWRGRDVSQQIGNAIPPRLGAHLLNSLLGMNTVLKEAFFERHRASWAGPSEADHRLVRNAIACAPAREGSGMTIIGDPGRVSVSHSDRTDHENSAPSVRPD